MDGWMDGWIDGWMDEKIGEGHYVDLYHILHGYMYFNILQTALKEIGDQLSEMKTELQFIESQQREVNEELLDLNHELERYSIKVKENQQKIKHFNNEVSNIIIILSIYLFTYLWIFLCI